MIILLLTLLGIALACILAGLLLSIPKAQTTSPREVSYAGRDTDAHRITERSTGITRTTDSVGMPRASSVGVPRTSGSMGRRSAAVGTGVASLSGQTGAYRYTMEVERRTGSHVVAATNARTIFGSRAGKPTPWLGLTFILLALFGFLLFSMRILFSNPGLIINPFLADSAATATVAAQNTANNLSAANLAGAAKALVRINQLDPAQYASQQEFNMWSFSACSAASMTEVINAYNGNRYRITDILKVEVGLKEITPDLGLLETAGIARTVAQFNFSATVLDNASLDTIISMANQGKPIIVGFPPDRVEGGHILVLRGGNSTQVYLADSSSVNRTVMGREQFKQLWGGLAVSVVPNQ